MVTVLGLRVQSVGCMILRQWLSDLGLGHMSARLILGEGLEVKDPRYGM